MKNKRQGVLFNVSPMDTSLYEKRLKEKGVKYIAGVDEVGRGCLAGPVFASAVILPYPCSIKGITDSKKLSARKRELLYDEIQSDAVSIGFGFVDSFEIDKINILQATLKAMRLAIEALSVRPDYVLVDGSHAIPINIPQLIIPKGDYRSITVGSASIMAKVKRDRLMCSLEKQYPSFSFSVHKGYGTSRHLAEIRKHGPTQIHRMSFKGVA